MLLVAQDEKAIGKIYNIGGEKNVSLLHLAKLLIEANGGSGEYTLRQFPDERKKIDIGDYYSDDARIRKELGWTPSISLEEGLSRTVAFYSTELKHYI